MSSPTRVKVLVIDDEENMRLVMRRILAAEGYEVVEAENGKAALDFLDRDVTDLIVCDVRMPVMDGLTFLRETASRGVRAPE